MSTNKKRIPTHFKLSHILLATTLLIVTLPLAFGQENLPGSEVVERDAEGKAKRVNLDFANAELQTVLRWLADEAKLTIIATEGDVKGKKFSLMNVKDVTIEEAMEYIKTVMAVQGLTLIHTDSTILITTLQKAVQMKVPVKDAFVVSEYEKKLKPSDEVITQPILFENAAASELSASVKPLLSGTSNILSDPNSNSLVITDVASNIYKICKLLTMFDTAPETALKVKIIGLENSDARSVAQTLNELFREETQVTNILRKMGRAKNPDEMRKMMERAREQGGGIDMISGRVQIVADTSSNSIIVKASERNITIIESLIKELDSAKFIEPKLRVFHVQHADAQQIASELEDLIQGGGISRIRSRSERAHQRGHVVRDRQRARARGETPSVGGVIGDVNIVSDSRLNAILISTDERNFPFIEMVLKELDKADTKEEFKIFYLEVADAEQMVDTLQDLILGTGGGSRSSWGRSYMRSRQRRERREWGGPGFGIQGEVNLVAEPRLNAILVSTEEQNLGTMEKIIKQLDTSMPGQEWATEIITLKEADAENVSSIIEQVFQGSSGSSRGYSSWYWMPRRQRTRSSSALSGNVSVEAYPTLNALIVSASTGRNLEQVKAFIKTLDEPTPEDEREVTRILKLEYADSQELQELLDQVWGEGSSSSSSRRRRRSSFFRSMLSGRAEQRDINSLKGKVDINYDEQTNSLVVTAKQRYWEDIIDLISELDIVRGQIFLDIQILEITLDESTKFGLELGAEKALRLHEWGTGDKKDELTGQINANLLLSQEISGFNYTLMTTEFMALIHALMDENKVRVLSRPAILTRDNQEATLTRGRRIPYLESVSYTSSTGSNQNNQGNIYTGQPLYNYDFLDDVGVSVTITPHIAKTEATEGGKRTIGLDITEIRASNFLGFTEFNAPLTEDSTVSAYIDVEEGRSILIGGMIKSKQQNKEKKLPLLGSLPLVGKLFKQTETVVEDSEIVMIITPHIVDIKNPEDVRRLEELREKQFGNTDEMMNESMNNNKIRINGNNGNKNKNNERNHK